MAVFVSNITIEQGFDFETTFELENISTTEPLDLNNYSSPTAQLRKTYTSSTATDFTVEVIDTNGILGVSMSATMTSALKPGRYVYDIRILGGDKIIKLVEGSAIVRGGVTR